MGAAIGIFLRDRVKHEEIGGRPVLEWSWVGSVTLQQ